MLGEGLDTRCVKCSHDVGKCLDHVLEWYKLCSHFMFLCIFHSVFRFFCFLSTMKMPFKNDRCLESTGAYPGVSFSVIALRSNYKSHVPALPL